MFGYLSGWQKKVSFQEEEREIVVCDTNDTDQRQDRHVEGQTLNPYIICMRKRIQKTLDAAEYKTCVRLFDGAAAAWGWLQEEQRLHASLMAQFPCREPGKQEEVIGVVAGSFVAGGNAKNYDGNDSAVVMWERILVKLCSHAFLQCWFFLLRAKVEGKIKAKGRSRLGHWTICSQSSYQNCV